MVACVKTDDGKSFMIRCLPWQVSDSIGKKLSFVCHSWKTSFCKRNCKKTVEECMECSLSTAKRYDAIRVSQYV